ncbi:hypothetical protein ACFY4C_22875 [Actinomadura viridis]|uniref:hypothetical protein n=1 Tax=Actinomadura viridis TaxID=58110 RepID=UPI0036CBD5F4
METTSTPEIELLSHLRAELAEHSLRSEIRQHVAGLAVSTNVPGVYLWVFVSYSGRYFSWNRANSQHPVHDVAGTARRIAEQMAPYTGEAPTP